MVPDDLATALYLGHLTDHDLALLCGPHEQGRSGGDLRSLVRNRRGGIDGFLDRPEAFEAVFGAGASRELVRVSPFLVFALAVHRLARDLGSSSLAPNWLGASRHVLVLDVPRLRDFLGAPLRRFFLVELLASYARVASGSVLVATRRGLRRHRFSELDPVQLAGLLEVVEPAERPGVLRRLGDLALFLTGVFPDYVARHGFGPVEQSRLLRLVGTSSGAGGQPATATAGRLAGDDAVELLARLGRRWYGAASRLVPRPLPADVAVVAEMPERFDDARQALSVLAERFLFRQRDRWFGLPPLQ